MRIAAALLAIAHAIPTPAPAARDGRHAFHVRSRDGVPQLLIDGTPARARIFWGSPGAGGRALLAAEWREYSFEFRAPADDREAALHLRFGEIPGEIWFDEVRLTDLTTGAPLLNSDFEDGQKAFDSTWRRWCKGLAQDPPVAVTVEPGQGRDGSAGLRVHLGDAPGKLSGLHLYRPSLHLIRGRAYKVQIRARASSERPFVPTVHHQGGAFQFYGGFPSRYAAQVRHAAARDVDLVSFPIPTLWREEGADEGTPKLLEACRTTLEANPDAFLIPRIGLYPPAWWLETHPDTVMLYEGDRRGQTASVSSRVYRADAAAALRRTIRACERAFGPRMAGYHPCGQNTGEWFYFDSWQHPLNGLEPATLEAWRAWLTRRYPSDAALRDAWKDPGATRAAATVPTPQERRATPSGQLRDPSRERRVLDFARFQQEEMAETVVGLARALREEAGPDRLSLFFYGYVFEFGPLNNGPAISGHYALRSVLGSPDIDVLCAPISYHDRGAGGGAPCMTAAESVMLAGKLWLNEDDTRTHLAKDSRAPGWRDGADTQAASVQLLRRNLAHEITRNFATWWMDLGASGWFDDPTLWAEMDRVRDAERALLARPRPFRPEIAAFLDEGAMLLVAGSGSSQVTTRPLIYQARAGLHRAGAPFAQYLLDDIVSGRAPRARLNVFLAAWQLDAPARAALRENSRGATNLWCWAPGYHTGTTPSTRAVTELTGFDVEPLPPGSRALARATADGLAAGLPPGFGPEKPVTPLLSPRSAPGDVILAEFDAGRPAVVLRRAPDGNSIFCATTELPSALVRHASRVAGVHLYTATDANVFANGDLLAVHACSDDPLHVDLPAPASTRDLVSGEVSPPRSRIDLRLKRGETALWLLQMNR